MSAPMERRDEILQRLLLDESDPLAAFARCELAGDATARAELVELLEAQRRVQGIASDEREMLRPSAPGSAERAAEDRMLERLRAHVGAQPPARRATRTDRNPFAKIVLLLAAALALFLGWRWLAGGEETEPDPNTKLGGGEGLEVEPVTTFGEITWKGKLVERGYFVVHILDGTPGASGDDEVASSPPLKENRWTPAEDEWKRWPDEIRIFVESWGPGGPSDLRARSHEVSARRSP
jgi:hypothetical protein